MKVLYFHNSIPEYRKELFTRLTNAIGDLIFVFTNFEYSKTIYNTEVNEKVLNNLGYKILSDKWSCIGETKTIIKQYNPDIIVLPALDTFRELVICKTILSCVNDNVGIIYFWEKWDAPLEYSTCFKRIKNFIQASAARLIFRHVDEFLAPGLKTEQYFKRIGVSSDHINIFHDVSTVEVCECIDLRRQLNIASSTKIILYYGRIIKRKGLDLLIKAINILNSYYDMYLVVAGDGDYKKVCEQLAEDLKLKNIKFVGFVHPSQKYNYFSQSDIFVLPSVADKGVIEAWGLTINEAIITNNFIVCSDIVGAGYNLVNHNNGVIYKQNDLNSLCNAIEKAVMMCGNSEMKRYNQALSKEYTYETMCNDFIHVFDKTFKMRRNK